MTKKANAFDILCIVVLLLFFFSIGLHVGKPKENDSLSEVIVTLTLVKSKIAPTDSELLIDGKYPCSLLYVDEDTAQFACTGKQRESGFLTSGAKHLSKNQPIELVGKNSYVYGRITKIEGLLHLVITE